MRFRPRTPRKGLLAFAKAASALSLSITAFMALAFPEPFGRPAFWVLGCAIGLIAILALWAPARPSLRHPSRPPV